MKHTLIDKHEMRMKLCGLPYIAGSLLLALLLLATSDASAAEAEATAAEPASLAGKVLGLTGARTKIIWLHSVAGKGEGWDALAAEYELRGFDTVDGKIRTILPGPASYANPCLTPDGNVVFYTDNPTNMIYRVNFDGTEKRAFCKGYSLCTWKDPKDGSQWIYFTSGGSGKGPILRCRIDKPEEPQVVWNKDQATHTLTISADGTRAGSCWPHPKAGVANLQTQTLRQYGRGCNPCIAPDNSYRFFHMGGEVLHSGIIMYDNGGINRRPIWFTGLPNRGPQDESWVPRWSNDVRFFTVSSPICGPKQQVYLGQFNERFTAVDKWIQITDEPGQNVKSIAWIDIGLGSFSGKAPYTVEIPAPGNGTWQWEFSDGGKTGDSPARHTFAKPGTYAITATQGDRTLKGTVRVAERAAPKLLSAMAVDDRRVLLTCSEPVQVAAAKVTLASGTAASKLSLDNEGIGIIAEFATPLAAKETLTVAGVTDCAQAPNEMAAAKVQVVKPDWPSNWAGLNYLWKNERTRNMIFDERIGFPVATELMVRGQTARFNRFGTAFATGGCFGLNPGSPERICEGIKKTNQFSFEVVVASADLAQTKGVSGHPISIVNLSQGWPLGIFWLLQEKDKLLVGLPKLGISGKPELFEMATLPDTKPHHLIVSCADKRLAFYLDGKKVKEIDPSPASFIAMGYSIQLASDRGLCCPLFPLELPWRGTLEYLAFYARFIEEDEAAKNAAVVAADLAKRTTLPQIEVKAVLLAKSDIPKAEDIAPYIHALTVCEYEVSQVMKGVYKQKKIRVAQWGLRDRQPTPLASRALRSESTLTLEAFTERTELENEVLRDTLPENLDMPLFVPAEE